MTMTAQVAGLRASPPAPPTTSTSTTIDTVSGLGSAAALAVPTAAFNARRRAATGVTRFTATGGDVRQMATSFASNQIVVFRAVPVSGP